VPIHGRAPEAVASSPRRFLNHATATPIGAAGRSLSVLFIALHSRILFLELPVAIAHVPCPRFRRLLRPALLATVSTCVLGSAVLAQSASNPTTTDIGSVTTTDPAADANAAPSPGTAAYVAPSRAPLSASQPTSVVGPSFIQNNIVPSQNYDDIIKLTPSTQNIAPAGPGLQQNFMETIRGFQYTQFNTTFDGLVLPGTPSRFAPQTAAYFTSHDLNDVQVDRGPGTASTIGYATFGGTVAMQSVSPSDTFNINPYSSVGSFNTALGGIALNSGSIAALNGAQGYLDLSRLSSGGYLTGTATRRDNAFTKLVAPVGDSTVITFVGMANESHNNTPYGAQLSQIQTLGANYGLNNNPRSQAYSAYNVDNYATDFEYLGVQSDLGNGWGLNNKVYTASYYHTGTQGADPNGTTPNLTGTYYVNGRPIALNNDVPGYANLNDFRDWGDDLRLTKDTDYGQLRFGMWFDYVSQAASKYAIVLTQNDAAYTKTAGGSPYSYQYTDTMTTAQPYVEFAWKPLPGLTITPGVKFTSVTRDLNAAINETTKLPADFSKTYSDVQPSIDAHYAFNSNWTAYAQIAKGFLAPPLNVLFVNQPSSLQPEQTWNYQLGTSFQKDWLTVGGDVYYIDFSNYITSQTIAGNTVYSNAGGAIYKGIELEATVRVGYGASLYGNYSVNQANYRSNNVPLAMVPRYTGVAGVLYEKNQLSGSLLTKFIGPQYLQDNGVQDQYPINAYHTVDLALGYTLPLPDRRKLNFRLNIDNLLDDNSLVGLAGTAGDGVTPLFWTDPGRSVFFSVSASL
jgi:iron complex outermembrane recepter protein